MVDIFIFNYGEIGFSDGEMIDKIKKFNNTNNCILIIVIFCRILTHIY